MVDREPEDVTGVEAVLAGAKQVAEDHPEPPPADKPEKTDLTDKRPYSTDRLVAYARRVIAPRLRALKVARAWESVPLEVLKGNNADEAVRRAFIEYGADPAFANEVIRRGWALFAAPEVIMGTRIEVNDQLIPGMIGASTEILGSMFGNPGAMDWETVERGLAEGPLVAEWITLRRHEFKENEKNVMWMALASIDPKRREIVVALAEQYLRRNPLTDEMSRVIFLNWFYNQARSQQQGMFADETTLGHIGEVLRAPLVGIEELVDSTIVKSMVGPDEFKWRNPLSLGQNIAMGMGVDPSEESFWWASGIWDFPKAIVFDPIIWLYGVGLGAKLVKTIPVMGELAEMGRVARALRVAVPWHGRRITNLPKYRRGPVARTVWSIFAKSHEQMIQGMAKSGVFTTMHEGAKAGWGVQEFVEFFPQLKGTQPGLISYLTSPMGVRVGPKWYEEIIRLTSGPGFEGRGLVEMERLVRADHEDAQRIFAALVEKEARAGNIHLGSLLGDVDGLDAGHVYRARLALAQDDILEWTDEVGELSGALLTRQTKLDEIETGAVLVFRGRNGMPRALNLADENELKGLLQWLISHPGRNDTWTKFKGLPAANRLERAIIEIAEDGPTDLDAALLLKRLADDPEMARLLFRYTEARDIDLLVSGSRAILTP
ncbi:MAG: hypothetical protein V3W28_07750, partial [Thermoplasmata archaeon]